MYDPDKTTLSKKFCENSNCQQSRKRCYLKKLPNRHYWQLRIPYQITLYQSIDLRYQNDFPKLLAVLHHLVSFDTLTQRHDLMDDRFDFAGPQYL